MDQSSTLHHFSHPANKGRVRPGFYTADVTQKGWVKSVSFVYISVMVSHLFYDVHNNVRTVISHVMLFV